MIGYENRSLQNHEFDNDLVDAGEIGAGHTVTAIYELVPVGAKDVSETRTEDPPLKYQRSAKKEESEEVGEQKDDVVASSDFELTESGSSSGELMTLALRYKLPEETESTRIEYPVQDNDQPFDEASSDFRFAASVASYGMLLRHSRFAGDWRLGDIENAGALALGEDEKGHRAAFLDLVRLTQQIVGDH